MCGNTKMNGLDLCLEVVLRSCQPLRHIRHWISRKLLEIEAWLQRTTSRKWPMGGSDGHVTDDVTWPWKVKLVTPIHLDRNISKTAGDGDFDVYLWVWCRPGVAVKVSCHCWCRWQVSVLTNEELALGLQQPAGIGQRPRPMSTETVISSGGSRTGSTDADQSDDALASGVNGAGNSQLSTVTSFLPSARNIGGQHKKTHGLNLSVCLCVCVCLIAKEDTKPCLISIDSHLCMN